MCKLQVPNNAESGTLDSFLSVKCVYSGMYTALELLLERCTLPAVLRRFRNIQNQTSGYNTTQEPILTMSGTRKRNGSDKAHSCHAHPTHHGECVPTEQHPYLVLETCIPNTHAPVCVFSSATNRTCIPSARTS